MTSVSKVLGCLINKNGSFCCLCLQIINGIEALHLEDKVIISLNGEESVLQLFHVLQLVLGIDVGNYVNTLDNICDNCARSVISSYTFIQTSQKNIDYMTNVLQELTNCLESATKDYNDNKSLFLCLNLKDSTSKHLYDSEQLIHNRKVVLKRLKSIESAKKLKLKLKENGYSCKIKKDNIKRKNKSKNVFKISTNSILLDDDSTLIKCKECHNVYPSILSLRNHYIRVHAPKKFKCNICSRSYGSQVYLDAHKKESHCTVICSECGKTFHNRHSLKMHEMGHYMTIICPDCGRSYKNKSTFKIHKELNICGQATRADPSQAKFTCDYCNKKYTQKMSLRVHIQHEHGNYKSHMCEWCGKKFWAQSRLKAHIVKHTKEKKFICNVCGGKFVTKESLLYHTRIHTGEKPYDCPQCNCKFLSASRRSEHLKRHHVGGTLECDVCHSKFTSRSYLQKHRRMHKLLDNELSDVECNEVKVEYVINEDKCSEHTVYHKGNTENNVNKFATGNFSVGKLFKIENN